MSGFFRYFLVVFFGTITIRAAIDGTRRFLRRRRIPEAFPPSESGGVEVLLRITETLNRDDGSIALLVRGSVQGLPVRLGVEFGPAWRKQKGEALATTGVVVFRSFGPDSDRLLAELNRAYGSPLQVATMAERVTFSAIALEGHPALRSMQPIKLKLFIESENPESQAEMFMNVYPYVDELWLTEKDNGYREAIIHALSGTPAKEPLAS